MTRFLLRKGIVKSEKQAMSILFLITLIFFALTAFVLYTSFFKQVEIVDENLSPEQKLLIESINNPK